MLIRYLSVQEIQYFVFILSSLKCAPVKCMQHPCNQWENRLIQETDIRYTGNMFHLNVDSIIFCFVSSFFCFVCLLRGRYWRSFPVGGWIVKFMFQKNCVALYVKTFLRIVYILIWSRKSSVYVSCGEVNAAGVDKTAHKRQLHSNWISQQSSSHTGCLCYPFSWQPLQERF